MANGEPLLPSTRRGRRTDLAGGLQIAAKVKKCFYKKLHFKGRICGFPSISEKSEGRKEGKSKTSKSLHKIIAGLPSQEKAATTVNAIKELKQ